MNFNNNFKGFTEISMRKAAVITGISLLIMTILAPVANFIGLQNLIVSNNAAATVTNILNSEGLFRFSIFAFFIVLILDIVIAWGFYVLLKPVNKSIALLAAWFRVVYVAFLGNILINLFSVMNLLGNKEYINVFGEEQLNSWIMILVDNFNIGWDISFIIFGLHLLILGFLIYKSNFISNILGIFVIVSSLGYLIDSTGKILCSNYNLEITMFTFVGEVLLIFWLFGKVFTNISLQK